MLYNREKSKRRKHLLPPFFVGTSKPVSRVLSFKTAIYLDAQLPVRSSRLLNTAGPACCVPTALLRIEFTASRCSHVMGELLPRLSTLTTAERWRYISVALFLKSPSAGVTRYPCPVEPGLSSWTAFRPAHAAVQLTCIMYFTKKESDCQITVVGV